MDLGQDTNAPLVTGRPYNPLTGFENLPFVGTNQNSNPLSGIVTMMLQPRLQSWMQQQGYSPFGFAHSRNYYDKVRVQEQMRRVQAGMTEAAAMQQQGFYDALRSGARIAGQPWGPAQHATATQWAGGLASATPFLAQMAPDFLDQLSGQYGSPVVLANRLLDADRFLLDPQTGLPNLDHSRSLTNARGIFAAMQTPDGLRDFRGMSAGQVGSLYQELARQGLLGGQRSTAEQLRSLTTTMAASEPASLGSAMTEAGLSGLSTSQLLQSDDATLSKLLTSPEMQRRVQEINTTQIKESLRTYSGAVAAIREIFGDSGRADAPMAELIEGLQALAGGTMTELAPRNMERLVRNMYEASRSSGIPLEVLGQLQQQGAAVGQQYGLRASSLFASQNTADAAAFSLVYRSFGGANITAWNRAGADELTAMDVALRQSAAASEQSNLTASLLRLEAEVGGFAPGSDQARLAEAARREQTTFVDAAGNTRTTMLSTAEARRLLRTAKDSQGQEVGLSENEAIQRTSQNIRNQQFILENPGVTRQTRRLMEVEMAQLPQSVLQTLLTSRLNQSGLDQDTSTSLARDAAAVLAPKIAALPEEVFADSSKRNAAIGRFVREYFQGLPAQQQGGLGALTDSQAGGLAASFFGETEYQLSLSQYGQTFRNSYSNLHVLMNPGLQEQVTQQIAARTVDARISEAMSGLGPTSGLRAAVTALQTSQSTDDIPTLIARTLGIETGEAARRLAQETQALQTEIENIRKNFGSTPTNQQDAMLQHLIDKINSVQQLYQSQGVDSVAEPLQAKHATQALQSQEQLKAFADPIAANAPNRTQQEWEAFYKTEDGQFMKFAASDMQQQTAEFLNRLRKAPETLGSLGPEALENADKLRRSYQRLTDLASRHTGGDMGKLVAGEHSAADWVREEVKTLLTETVSSTRELQKLTRSLEPSEGEAQDSFHQRRAAAVSLQTSETRERARQITEELSQLPISAETEKATTTPLDTAMRAAQFYAEQQPGSQKLSDTEKLARLFSDSLTAADHSEFYAAYGANTPKAREELQQALQSLQVRPELVQNTLDPAAALSQHAEDAIQPGSRSASFPSSLHLTGDLTIRDNNKATFVGHSTVPTMTGAH